MRAAIDRLRAVLVPALALGLAACGGHLHRQADALVSEAAMKEVEALEFDEGFAAREQIEAELLDEELEAALHEVAAARDAALLAVIDDLGGGGRRIWERDLDRKLEGLTGVGFDADMGALGERYVQAAEELGAFEAAIRELERERDTYLARAVELDLPARRAPMPRCPGADDPARDPGLDSQWQGFAEACAELHATLVAIGGGGGDGGSGGELQRQARTVARIHELLEGRARVASELRQPYERARERCSDAGDKDEAKEKNNKDETARIVEVAACLAPELEATLLAADAIPYAEGEEAVLSTFDLDSVGAGPGDPAHLGVVEEQLAAVDRVLAHEAAARVTSDAVRDQLEGTTQAAEVGLALAVVGTVARVRLDVDKGRYSLGRAELVLVRELLALERDGTREIHELGRRRLDLLHLGLEAMLRERLSLLAAESFLLDPSCAGLSITDAITHEAGADAGAPEADTDTVAARRQCATFLDGSLIQYANAWSLGAARRREAEVRADALFEREMRVRSGMTLAIRGVWIAAAVAELHRYNATGLDPQTLATLLTNVAGFAVVAAGVFR